MNLKIVFKKQGGNSTFLKNLESISGFPTYSSGDDLTIDLSAWPDNFHLFVQEKNTSGKVVDCKIRSHLFSKIADNDEERMYREHLNGPIEYVIYTKYGFLSDLFSAKMGIFTSTSKALKDRLEDFYNLGKADLNFCHVYAAFIDTYTIQSVTSILKLSYYFNQFGIENSIDYVNAGVMEGLIPSAIHFKSFVDAFLIINPAMYAFPLSRMESHICFLPKERVVIPSVASTGIPEKFINSNYPMMGTSENNPIYNLNLSSKRIVDLCEAAHFAIDNLFQHIFDLSRYANDQGEIDGFKFVQAYSGAWLIFSDFMSASSSLDDYAKTNFCFTCLDKVANFIKADDSLNEAEVWKKFFNKNYLDSVIELVDSSIGCRYEKLTRRLINIFNDNNKNIAENGDSSNDIRVYRNLQHGTYLNRDQFAELFFNKKKAKLGVGTIYMHTYFLVFAFSLDAKKFVSIFKGN